MSSYPPPGPSGSRIADGLDSLIDRIQFEVQQATKYVNDAVVPQVRAESIVAMRKISETLNKLADRMERPRGSQAG
jgi:hypothetical protein